MITQLGTHLEHERRLTERPTSAGAMNAAAATQHRRSLCFSRLNSHTHLHDGFIHHTVAPQPRTHIPERVFMRTYACTSAILLTCRPPLARDLILNAAAWSVPSPLPSDDAANHLDLDNILPNLALDAAHTCIKSPSPHMRTHAF
jgi:hypothetical protein